MKCEETQQGVVKVRETAVSFCPQTQHQPMNDIDRDAALLMAGILLLLCLIAGSVTYLQASSEAAAFNRLTTGPKVTTWDAVWLDLRVEAR